MRKFELTIKCILQARDQEEANNTADEILGVLIINYGNVMDVDGLRFDAVIMPQDYQEPVASRKVDPVPAGYPPDAPPHPWDEGLHIFPVDHPYRAVEDLYFEKAQRGEYHPETVKELEESLKQLPPPVEIPNPEEREA